MESSQYSAYEYFIDILAELVIEHHTESIKRRSTEKEERC